MTAWIVWSERDGAWLGSGAGWYIASLMRAGLYNQTDAQNIMQRNNRFLAPGIWHVWAMQDPLGRDV